MAQIICPNCGNLIPDKAAVCPVCGQNSPLNPTIDSVPPPVMSTNTPADHQPLPHPKKKHFSPYNIGNNDEKHNNRGNRGNRGKSNRVVWIWIIILLLAGGGIGTYLYLDNKNKSKQNEHDRQEQLRRETIAGENARDEKARAEARARAEAEARKQMRRDSLDWYSFTSPDLNLLDVHGHVKSLDYSFSDDKSGPYFIFKFQQNFKFNEQGILSNITATRNNLDQITDIKQNLNDEYYSDFLNMSIEWSGDFPYIIRGYTTYYNETSTLNYINGRLKSINSDYGTQYDTSIKQTIEINPETIDRHGNWTTARVVVNGIVETYEWSDVMQEEFTKSQEVYYTYTIIREIEYYPFLH